MVSEAEVRRLVDSTLAREGRLDILVNNAGIMGPVKNIQDINVSAGAVMY